MASAIRPTSRESRSSFKRSCLQSDNEELQSRHSRMYVTAYAACRPRPSAIVRVLRHAKVYRVATNRHVLASFGGGDWSDSLKNGERESGFLACENPQQGGLWNQPLHTSARRNNVPSSKVVLFDSGRHIRARIWILNLEEYLYNSLSCLLISYCWDLLTVQILVTRNLGIAVKL